MFFLLKPFSQNIPHKMVLKGKDKVFKKTIFRYEVKRKLFRMTKQRNHPLTAYFTSSHIKHI